MFIIIRSLAGGEGLEPLYVPTKRATDHLRFAFFWPHLARQRSLRNLVSGFDEGFRQARPGCHDHIESGSRITVHRLLAGQSRNTVARVACHDSLVSAAEGRKVLKL